MEIGFEKDFKKDFESWKKHRVDNDFLQVDYKGCKIRVYDLFTQFVISEKLNYWDSDRRIFFYDKFLEGHRYGICEGYATALKKIDPLLPKDPYERSPQIEKLQQKAQDANSDYYLILNGQRLIDKGYYNGIIQQCKRQLSLFSDKNDKVMSLNDSDGNHSDLDSSSYSVIAIYLRFRGDSVNILNAKEKLEGFKNQNAGQLAEAFKENSDFKNPQDEDSLRANKAKRRKYQAAKVLLEKNNLNTHDIDNSINIINGYINVY